MKLLPKITTSLLLILIPILAVLSYLQIQKVQKVLYSFLEKQEKVLKITISAGVMEPLLVNDYPILNTYLNTLIENYDDMYLIELEKDGQIVASVINDKLKDEPIKYSKHNIKLYENTIGKLRFGLSTKPTEEAIKDRINNYLILSFLLSSILFFSLLFIIKKHLLQYIDKLKIHAATIGEGNYSKTINIDTKDEFNDLANSINQMTKNIFEASQKSNELTEKLKEQKRKLILANKSKDMFLANMSHELKTPLNSINLISSVMSNNRENNLSQKQLDNLKIINISGKNLLYLVNDILDISKLEAGEITINYQTFNFEELINEIDLTTRPLAEDKNIVLRTTYDQNITYIYNDKNRVEQIIKNFLSNSIKFTKNGQIELKVVDNDQFVNISVIDNGIGIEEDKLAIIFDRFKQVDGSTTRKYGGSGLGLSISNELAKILNAEILVNSIIDKGSTFTLKLPKNKDMIKINNVKEEVTISKKEKILILTSNHMECMKLVINLQRKFKVTPITKLSELNKELDEDYKYLIVDSKLVTFSDLKKIKTPIIFLAEDINAVEENIKKILKKYAKKYLKNESSNHDISTYFLN
jgi:signal transduction histidine kinase